MLWNILSLPSKIASTWSSSPPHPEAEKEASIPSPQDISQPGKLDSTSPDLFVVQSPPPTLYAITIGINKYRDPDVTNLYGAIADADSFQRFLISELGVPKDRVLSFRDEGATREAIIKAMKNLAHNPAISEQDPIVIYYAGHGSEALPPSEKWNTSNTTGKVQMLIPHDFIFAGSSDHHGQGIFDVTLSRLLAEIAKNKSDNITVILDSCHSGSSTRNDRDKTIISRGFNLPDKYSIPINAFDSETRASSVVSAYKQAGLKSHTLLAACGQGQSAMERQGHGVFTSALLSLLRKEGVEQLTYQDVINRLPDLPLQNPQCEGDHQTRILFNAKVASPYRNVYPIHPSSSNPGEYTLEAGEAHGIMAGSKFAVHADREMLSQPIGSVVASKLAAFRTQCIGDPQFSLSQQAFAVQTHVGEGKDIRIFIEKNDAFLDLFVRLRNEMDRTDSKRRSFHFVKDISEEPDLAITVQDGKVRFHIMEKLCRQYGLTQMPFDDIPANSTDYLFSILSSAADFYWQLYHSKKGRGTPEQKTSINVKCLKLVLSDGLDVVHVPELGGQDLNVNGTIIIDVNENTAYGYEITNSSTVPLYVALFYFDASDLTIEKYYSPGTAAHGQVDFSLPAKGSLHIGYGDSGTNPHSYFLRPNQNVDVGFLKLYISTEFVDYSYIAQGSPFNSTRYTVVAPAPKRYFWDTLVIPMIQGKGAQFIRPVPSSGESGGGLSRDLSAEFGIGWTPTS